MIGIKIKGLDAALREVKSLARKFPDAGFRSLVRQGELIMTDSKKNYVPVLDGELRGSGHVVPDKPAKQVTLGFGGPAGIGNQGASNKEDVGYAIDQHETKNYQHTVGESEFLKKPVDKAAGSLAQDMAKDIKDEVGL